jgi:hypothetical protein
MATDGSDHEATVAGATRNYSDEMPLRLLYGGSIVVQLGSQLYPSVTAAVAELVSNAWDADASNVWVTVPFGQDWEGEGSTIEVLDDGIGMSRRDAQLKYLVVGRERRADEKTDRTPSGRLLHGRKGIGKLAAFGTGRSLEVLTQEAGAVPVRFRLDYDDLRALEPAESASVDELDPEPLVDPAGSTLASGTRVRLARLQAKRRPSEGRFLLSMTRRFSLDESLMRVHINDQPLRRFEMDFQYRFPPDAIRPGATEDEHGFAVETVDDGAGNQREVRWWIGFLKDPVRDELLQGVSVLVRGKQAQKPFKFERTGGTQSQLGYEYLVGEVHADWIDDGTKDDEDLIASNRDSLQLEDPRLQPFIAWGRQLLVWALTERGRKQAVLRAEEWNDELPQLEPVLEHLALRERQALGRVAQRLGRVDGLGASDVAELMQRVLDVREHRTADNIAAEMRSLGDAANAFTWELADSAAFLERRTAASAVEARLALLDRLAELVGEEAAPPDLAHALATNPWLIDLRFDRAATRRIDAPSEAGEALILIGPPVWDPDDTQTVLAAFWDDSKRPGDDAEWLAAVQGDPSAADAQVLLVAQAKVELDGVATTTWAQCLALSRRQHELWLALAREGLGR